MPVNTTARRLTHNEIDPATEAIVSDARLLASWGHRQVNHQTVAEANASSTCPIHLPQPPPPPYQSSGTNLSPTQFINNYYISLPSSSRHRQRSSRTHGSGSDTVVSPAISEVLHSLGLEPPILEVLLRQLLAPPLDGHDWQQYLEGIGVPAELLPVLIDIVSHIYPAP